MSRVVVSWRWAAASWKCLTKLEEPTCHVLLDGCSIPLLQLLQLWRLQSREVAKAKGLLQWGDRNKLMRVVHRPSCEPSLFVPLRPDDRTSPCH